MLAVFLDQSPPYDLRQGISLNLATKRPGSTHLQLPSALALQPLASVPGFYMGAGI